MGRVLAVGASVVLAVVAMVLLKSGADNRKAREGEARVIADAVRQTVKTHLSAPSTDDSLVLSSRARGKCDPTDIDYHLLYTLSGGREVSFAITGDCGSGTYAIRVESPDRLPKVQRRHFGSLLGELNSAFEAQGWTRVDP